MDNSRIATTSNEPIGKKCKIAILLTTIFYVVLQMGMPVYMRAQYTHDDMLLVNYANTILQGEWLGAYGVYTLNKNPMFAIFLVLCKILNLPYMLAIGLCYSFAAFIFFLAIRRFVKKDWMAYILYVYVLFSPVMFDINIGHRIYRNAVIPIFVLLVVSCYLVLYADRKTSFKKLLPWAIGGGVAFAAFYLTREDSIWLGCFAIGATFLTIVKLLWEKKVAGFSNKNFVARIFCMCIPIMVCFLGVQSVKLINYSVYGVYATTDFNDTAFVDMGKAILSVQPEEDSESEYVWVSRETIGRLYEVSPTLETIHGQLDGELNHTDIYGSGITDGESDDVFVMWAIRWAVRDAGLYTTAEETNAFYQQVADEIEAAFESGELEKRDAIVFSNLSKPMALSDFPDCLAYLADRLLEEIAYEQIDCAVLLSEFDETVEEDLELMSDITNTKPVTSEYEYIFSGWAVAYNDDSKLTMEVVDEDGETTALEWEESSEVWDFFANQGQTYNNAKECRFTYSYTGSHPEECTLNIYLDGELILSEKLTSVETIDTESAYYLCVDNNAYDTSAVRSYSTTSVSIGRWIVKVYQKTGYLLAAIAMILFVAEIIFNIMKKIRKQKVDFSSWLIKVGFLLTIFADGLIVSINFYSLDYFENDIFSYYTPGIYVIWQVFVCLCIVKGIDFAREIRQYRQNKVNSNIEE